MVQRTAAMVYASTPSLLRRRPLCCLQELWHFLAQVCQATPRAASSSCQATSDALIKRWHSCEVTYRPVPRRAACSIALFAFTSAAKAGSADASEATRIRRKKVAEPSRQPRNARASRRVTRPAAAAASPRRRRRDPRKDTYLRRSTAPRSRSAASSWRGPSSLLSD